MKEEIENSFLKEYDEFYNEIKNIVGEFDIEKNISERKNDFNQFLTDINNIFEPNNLVLSVLKGRTQLGLLPRTREEWKDAKHTRYEHSIGVTVKCIIICAYLNSKINDNDTPKLTEQDIRELALAAALHDVGHLPVSHAVERAFLFSDYNKEEVRHESRIIPMFLGENHPLFKYLFDNIQKWNHFDNYNSQLRVACLISEDEASKYIKSTDFQYPKRVLQQLLSSEIDMDRLDFILRDAKMLQYTPVTLIRNEILSFIKGLSLRSTYQTSKNITNNIELCIDSNYNENIFIFLVSRLLMYKDCYFAPEVRAFEGLLTYIVSEFLLYGPKLNSEELIEYSDEDFCVKYLNDRVNFLPLNGNNDKCIDIPSREHIRKQIQAINENKTNRYKFFYFIDLKSPQEEDNKKLKPRLKDELEMKINNHAYINDIKNRIINQSIIDLGIENKFKRSDFIIDVFSIKEGEGNILVNISDKNPVENKKIKLLKDFMNGSNIHRLYTKKRLDFYHKSDLSPERLKVLKNQIIKFFYE